ncbi:MAG: hypothetical protein HZB47_00260 [Nitrosomonadales bacterium]|nr:hypothetical protein [Nitrosomonadales bacterium]
MKRYQTGEAMLVVMVVMMTIVFLSRGHMGMMGPGPAAHPAEATPPGQTVPAAKPAPDASSEPQR